MVGAPDLKKVSRSYRLLETFLFSRANWRGTLVSLTVQRPSADYTPMFNSDEALSAEILKSFAFLMFGKVVLILQGIPDADQRGLSKGINPVFRAPGDDVRFEFISL